MNRDVIKLIHAIPKACGLNDRDAKRCARAGVLMYQDEYLGASPFDAEPDEPAETRIAPFINMVDGYGGSPDALRAGEALLLLFASKTKEEESRVMALYAGAPVSLYEEVVTPDVAAASYW